MFQACTGVERQWLLLCFVESRCHGSEKGPVHQTAFARSRNTAHSHQALQRHGDIDPLEIMSTCSFELQPTMGSRGSPTSDDGMRLTAQVASGG